MGTKVYVGNLPFSVSNDDLKETFSPYGEVTEAVVISDKYSGRSKGSSVDWDGCRRKSIRWTAVHQLHD